jgi:cytochrome P450
MVPLPTGDTGFSLARTHRFHVRIGKRFGQLVVKSVAAVLLQRFHGELRPGHELRVAKLPKLSPEGGLPLTVRASG